MSKMYPAKTKSSFSELRKKANLNLEEVASLIGKSTRTIYRYENTEGSAPYLIMEKLNTLAKEPLFSYETNKKESDFKFIDLFAGIGGLRAAFEKIGGQCVFTSEWDENAKRTYQANFGFDHPFVGDITKIDEESIPSFDVLLAGFPCQPFSLAGVSKKNALGKPHGFKDETQGTLFFDVARIIEFHKPKAFLLENVKNLISHDKGKTFSTILKVLQEDLGYTVKYKVIDAAHFLPQHRERIYIVGFKDSCDFTFNNLELPLKGLGPKLESILHSPMLDNDEEPQFYYNGEVNPRYTLSDNLWNYLQKYKEKHQLKGNGFGFGLVGPDNVSRTLSARYHKDGSEILIEQKGKNPRRLTPRECARLMGFDSLGNPNFRIIVSDTQAYRQFGNSVAVPVVLEVAKLMKPFLVKEISQYHEIEMADIQYQKLAV